MTAVHRLKSVDFYRSIRLSRSLSRIVGLQMPGRYGLCSKASRKIPRDLTEASLSGGGLSIIAAVSMVLLFVLELKSYLSISTTTAVVVDRCNDGDLLRINFNFSFPALSCEFASVDVSDVLGTHRFNLTKTVRKYPINQHLEVVGPEHHPDPVPVTNKHGDEHHDRQLAEMKHGVYDDGNLEGALVLTDDNFDHYVAEYPVVFVNFFAPWCPWCQRLEPSWEKASKIMAAKYNPEADGRIRLAKVDCTIHQNLCRSHHIQGFPSLRIFRMGQNIRDIHGQHDHESYYGNRDTDALVEFAESLVPEAVLGEDGNIEMEHNHEKSLPHAHLRRKAPSSGGCKIEGFVLVKKVPGNLMVSASSGSHSFDPASMNMSHAVDHLSFGRKLARWRQDELHRLMPHLPQLPDRLTGNLFVSHHDNLTHDHYLQVVKTEVLPLRKARDDKVMLQYEYTAHSNTLQAETVPVARFHYELSPMQVLISEQRRSFSHFLTNVCAIIGGVFTVAGILDSMLHGAASLVKKVQLGKQS
eukprot:SM000047S16897  [mRNA]  locus=s47:664276:669297:+ [translate_table: standard]